MAPASATRILCLTARTWRDLRAPSNVLDYRPAELTAIESWGERAQRCPFAGRSPDSQARWAMAEPIAIGVAGVLAAAAGGYYSFNLFLNVHRPDGIDKLLTLSMAPTPAQKYFMLTALCGVSAVWCCRAAVKYIDVLFKALDRREMEERQTP